MHWFKPWGILFIPVAPIGWLATLSGGAFCTQIFFFVDARSHSISDTLYGIFPFWAATFLLLAWLADRTGGGSR